MTFVEAGGARLHYRVDGPADAPTLLLSSSLGTDLSTWQPQMPAFAERFRVVRHDTRGHGRSDAPPGPYTIDRLGADALAVLDAAGVERADVCGLSLGGLVSLWLAAHTPGRVRRGVFSATAARIGTPELWQERAEAVLSGGMAAVVDPVLSRFFTDAFRAERPDVVAGVRAILSATTPQGYAAACLCLRDADLRDAVARIAAPSLIVVGSEDLATPVSDAAWLQRRIPRSELVVLEGAGHLASLERPERFAEAVVRFLSPDPGPPASRGKEGTR